MGLVTVAFISHPRHPTVNITASGIEGKYKKGVDLPFTLDQAQFTLQNAMSRHDALEGVELQKVTTQPVEILKQNIPTLIQNNFGGNKLMSYFLEQASPFFKANEINLTGIGLAITPQQTVRATFQAV